MLWVVRQTQKTEAKQADLQLEDLIYYFDNIVQFSSERPNKKQVYRYQKASQCVDVQLEPTVTTCSEDNDHDSKPLHHVH